MERNGTKRNRIKSLSLLRTPEDRSTPGMAPPSACSSGSLRRSREDGNLASLSRPQPPHVPGRSAQQTTPTRHYTVANMPKNEYDDSNAAARPRFRPVARVTHLHKPQAPVPKVPTSVARPTATRSDPGRGQGTPPEPVPVPATQSRRWRHRLRFPRRRSDPFST